MSTDLVLAGDRWAPVTSRIGFLAAPIEDVVDHLQRWRTDIHGTANALPLTGDLADNLHRLEPLTGGVRPRELVIATRSPTWTAVFDCGVQGGDQVTTVGYLARTMLAQGVVVLSIPDRPATPTMPDRYGGRQFELFSPIPTDFLNYTRTISLIRNGARWRFDATGTVQTFEEVDAYRRRIIAQRFTPDMLQRYAEALDLQPWDPDFYAGPATLITNAATPPPDAWELTIADTQRRLGIVPD